MTPQDPSQVAAPASGDQVPATQSDSVNAALVEQARVQMMQQQIAAQKALADAEGITSSVEPFEGGCAYAGCMV
jgi:hypothetical protein